MTRREQYKGDITRGERPKGGKGRQALTGGKWPRKVA